MNFTRRCFFFHFTIDKTFIVWYYTLAMKNTIHYTAKRTIKLIVNIELSNENWMYKKLMTFYHSPLNDYCPLFHISDALYETYKNTDRKMGVYENFIKMTDEMLDNEINLITGDICVNDDGKLEMTRK